jgi:hypothetical protein
MKCQQSGMMGPIGAQMVPISHHMIRLIGETTSGCLLVPETAKMSPKWHDGTNWCSDGANITSDGQIDY